MQREFEWDQVKADENIQKHRLGFEEAITVFSDPNSITIFDPDHSSEENRYTKALSNIKRLFPGYNTK